jgi:hypothetical protein
MCGDKNWGGGGGGGGAVDSHNYEGLYKVHY